MQDIIHSGCYPTFNRVFARFMSGPEIRGEIEPQTLHGVATDTDRVSDLVTKLADGSCLALMWLPVSKQLT